MRLLYLCHRLPYPPDKGDRLRAFHHLRQLGRHHEVHLLSLTDRRRDEKGAAHLAEHCRVVECFPRNRIASLLRCSVALVNGTPLTLSFFRSRALLIRLRNLARHRRFDAVVVQCSSMVPYAALFPDLPRLLDLVDVDSAKWSQYAGLAGFPRRTVYALEARRLGRFESRLHNDFDRIVVTTERELRTLREICPEARAGVVRIGIDLAGYEPAERKASRPTLVFVGQMDYFANVDGVLGFARQVLPRLRARFADLRFLVVGRAPTAEIRALAETPGIRVTGEVADVRPYLARAWVFVAPLRIARGVQYKVLEAMAMGLPTVCSPRVFSGLADGGFRDGHHLRVAEDPDQWLAALCELLEDARLRSRLGSAGRQQLRLSYSWERNSQRLEEALAAMVDAGPPAHRYREIA